MTFYLKYRSQTLEELDLTEARESLKKIMAGKDIPHAFLFAGPKGTGKTSAARIIAKMVNCIDKNSPCGRCDQCLKIARGNNIDVIEIDAASNRGIDDIRLLREGVKLAPVLARKKIYIIDEAHMLTPEAANALLKTLEEPPDHVIFVLATTNPEKLIETIKSRTTLIPFSKAKPEEILRSLKRVVKAEKIKAEEPALLAIARQSEGSFRDAVKILEQIVNEKIKLNLPEVSFYLKKYEANDIEKLLLLLFQKDGRGALKFVENYLNGGGGVQYLIKGLLERLREALLFRYGISGRDLTGVDNAELIDLLERVSQVFSETPGSYFESLPLEIMIARYCGKEKNPADNGDSEKEAFKGEISRVKSGNGEKAQTKREGGVVSEKVKDLGLKVAHSFKNLSEEVWKTILCQIRPLNASVEALLRAAKPLNFDGQTLTLGVYYKFHKERLEEVPHRRLLEDVAGSVLRNRVRIICTLTQPPKREEIKENLVATLTEGKDNDIIKIAEEIFK